jgi:hypothetical protein
MINFDHLHANRSALVLGRRGPDALVAGLLGGGRDAPTFLSGTPLMVHSTSWRYEASGTVVLTYLAYGEKDESIRTRPKGCSDRPEERFAGNRRHGSGQAAPAGTGPCGCPCPRLAASGRASPADGRRQIRRAAKRSKPRVLQRHRTGASRPDREFQRVSSITHGGAVVSPR